MRAVRTPIRKEKILIFMKKTRIFVSASLKGGVGKSTVVANVAYQLAKRGKTVLLCDLDFDVRALDLIMGLENDVMFNISDVVSGKCTYAQARVADKNQSNLFFLGAPYDCKEGLDPVRFASVMHQIANEQGLDYIFFDTPGADNASLACALSVADEAMIVASHTPASLRGAQKSAEICYEAGVTPRLIVNSFDYDSVKNDRRCGINDIIDQTRVSLLGVVPYDRNLFYAQENGILACNGTFISEKAFSNIADRIIADETGERYVPILKGVKALKRKKILTK